MRYALHDIQPGQFESLVVDICHELLGPGVQGFVAGPDGGRDAKFVGTAQEFPSKASPLTGTTIVQAKHTVDVMGKFSDSDFGGNSPSSVLSKEIPRIKCLREDSKIDNYVLFSNRRLGANANESITDRIVKEAGIPVIHLVGNDDIERYVKRYPALSKRLSDFEYDLPLRASPDDLAEVITAIAKEQPNLAWPKSSAIEKLDRIAFKKKNEFNGLSEEYAHTITSNYLKHFSVIEKFLADPINSKAYTFYKNAVDEFASKLVAYRNDFESYDKLLEHLVSMLIERDGDLRSNKRLTRTVFYFMYWSCDIGTTEEESNASTK